MTFLNAIVLGVVQGITEFLPISSTGHMILTSNLLKIPSTEFLKTFEIFIQLGSILAVVVLYWRKFFDFGLIKKLIVAFLPTGILGLTVYKIVKQYLMGNEMVVLWSLFLGGIFLIGFERFYKEKEGSVGEVENISYLQALCLGVFQSLAMIPGVSRSAATVVGGLAMGLKRKTIVEFSFLLAVPTMLAASGLDLLKTAPIFSAQEFVFLALGFLTAFLVAMVAIKWLLKFVKNHSFAWFGVYRILLALIFFLFLAR